MKNNRKGLLFILTLLLITVNLQSYSLCATAPAEASYSCSGGNGVAVDGHTIINGEIFWYSGTGTFTTKLIIEKGGTLIVCGDLTLNGGLDLQGDTGGSGVVVVKTGGLLRVVGNTSVNGKYYNYGTSTFSNTLTINASGAQFINAQPHSQVSVSGNTTINGSTNFVNFGHAMFNSEFTSNASASVCLGSGSTMSIGGQLRNDGANTWTSPDGHSCVSYSHSGNSPLNQALTATSNIHLCVATGAGTISNYGSADYNTGCISCSVELPIELSYFKVNYSQNNNSYSFDWRTFSESNNEFFTIEYSLDGINFYSLTDITAAGNSTQTIDYSSQDFKINSPNEIIYFRLKQTDFDGNYSYSDIIPKSVNSVNDNIQIQKTEQNQIQLNLELAHANNVSFTIYTVQGIALQTKSFESLSNGNHIITSNTLQKGVYVCKVQIANTIHTYKVSIL